MEQTFEQWVKGKYEDRGSYWISVKEKVEWWFNQKQKR